MATIKADSDKEYVDVKLDGEELKNYQRFFVACQDRDVDEINELMPKNPEVRTNWLFNAANQCHIETIKYFLNRKFNQNVNDYFKATQYSPFHEACRSGEELEISSLLPNTISKRRLWLSYALCEDDIFVTHTLLNEKYNPDIVNVFDKKSYRKFMDACEAHDKEGVRELMPKMDCMKKLWLYYAMLEDHYVVIKTILKRKYNENVDFLFDKVKFNLFAEACEKKNDSEIKNMFPKTDGIKKIWIYESVIQDNLLAFQMLYTRRYNARYSDLFYQYDYERFQAACKKGNNEEIRELLPLSLGKQKFWLFLALFEDHIEVTDILLNRRFNPLVEVYIHESTYLELKAACKNQDKNEIIRIMPRNLAMAKIWLYYLMCLNQVELVQLVLNKTEELEFFGALINANRLKSFLEAIEKNNDSEIRFFLPKTDGYKKLWFYHSLNKLNMDVVKVLLDKKINPKHWDLINQHDYVTFLEACKQTDDDEIINLMPDTMLKAKIWLYYALNEDNVEVLQALLNKKYNPNSKYLINQKEYNAFYEACKTKDEAQIFKLMPKETTIKTVFLHYAIIEDQMEVVYVLLNREFNDRVNDLIRYHQYSLFHDACKAKDEREMNMYLPTSEGMKKIWLYHALNDNDVVVTQILLNKNILLSNGISAGQLRRISTFGSPSQNYFSS